MTEQEMGIIKVQLEKATPEQRAGICEWLIDTAGKEEYKRLVAETDQQRIGDDRR